MIAVRSLSNNPEQFKKTVQKIVENTNMPLILCSLNPDVLEEGLTVIAKSRPLLYAANEKNWKKIGEEKALVIFF
jgi:acetyl-CoA decarbonylase/synthase complex subunit gamma